MKKYFDFNGTINGTNYLLRGLVNGIPALVLNMLLLENPANHGPSALIMLLLVIPMVWFGLSTTNKRLNALMPENKVLGWILNFLPFAGWILGIYLIFGNSKIEKHEG